MVETRSRKSPSSVELVLPVLNEAATLERSVRTLADFAGRELGAWDWRVVVADNGSSDGTDRLAARLAEAVPGVACFRLEQRGRGLALRKAWTESPADILCYMDVDLSTGLEALHPLLEALAGDYDLATGSRLAPGARVERSIRREVISRGYNLLARTLLGTSLSDHQCGFKGVTRRVVQELLPHVINNHWFFDTELFTLATWTDYRIKEVPVTWHEDPDSRVKLVSTMIEDLKGMARLRRTRRATLSHMVRSQEA